MKCRKLAGKGLDRHSFKQRIKSYCRFLRDVKRASGWSIATWCKNIRYNFFCKQVKNKVSEGKYFIINKYCIIVLQKGARLILGAPFYFGTKRIKGSKLESRLLIEKNGELVIQYAPYHIGYGADIEVFEGGLLEIGGGGGANIGLTIICGEHITIGRNSGCGRHVTIRDNNGNHFVAVRGYKTSHPVVIKDHVWMTEGCAIMPGSVLESGAIVSARSVVMGHVPSFSMVKGDPAKTVETEIYWKA